MDALTKFLEILDRILPAALCVGVTLYTMQYYNRRANIQMDKDKKLQAHATVLQLRLSAYERAILFLQRLEPSNLLTRYDTQGKPSQVIYNLLMSDIQAEYEHNIVQQLYISEEGWEALMNAKNIILEALNEAIKRTPPQASAAKFAETFAKQVSTLTHNPITQATVILRNDLTGLFLSD